MNDKHFFDAVRHSVFDGELDQDNVDGLNLLIAEGNRRSLTNKDLAYILATAAWETAYSMQPVEEAYWLRDPAKFQRTLRYYPWFGRGYVQLTWKENYRLMEDWLDVPLTEDPSLALDPEIATQVIFEGMIRGAFTGVALEDVIDVGKPTITEFANARTIVNGRDQDIEIAEIAISFLEALEGAGRSASVGPVVSTEKTKKARQEGGMILGEGTEDLVVVRDPEDPEVTELILADKTEAARVAADEEAKKLAARGSLIAVGALVATVIAKAFGVL